MRDRSRFHWLELYECGLRVVVCKNITKAHRRLFIGDENFDDCYALHSYANNKCVIFLRRDCINHSLIAHESFHAAHRITDRVGIKFHQEHQEAHAIVMGWVASTVYNDLRKWKIRIK